MEVPEAGRETTAGAPIGHRPSSVRSPRACSVTSRYLAAEPRSVRLAAESVLALVDELREEGWVVLAHLMTLLWRAARRGANG